MAALVGPAPAAAGDTGGADEAGGGQTGPVGAEVDWSASAAPVAIVIHSVR